MSTLSLCMIVKNEAAHLARCLDAVSPLVDEIVIGDTGSTDDTVRIARAYTPHVLTFPWCDDFAAARNFVLEHATGDWVLSLDADETVATKDHAGIRAAIERSNLDAIESEQRHYLVDGTVVGWKPGPGGYDEGRCYPGYFDVSCRRLFRRLPHLRWRNPVHEELVSIDPSKPLRATAERWVIHHFGKTDAPERLAAKAALYLRLGQQKATEQPRDPLAQYELGIQFQELQRWDDALAAFRRTAQIHPGFRQVDLYIAMCLARLGRNDAALTALAQARRTTPASAAEIYLEEGNIHLADHLDDKAAQAYRRALGKNPALAPAAFNLALLALRVPDRQAARDWLDKALTYAPFNRDARLLRATLKHEAGDRAGALADVDMMGDDPRGARLRARVALEVGDTAGAAAALDAVGPDNDPAHLSLAGAIALARGRHAEARASLEAAWPGNQTVETALNLATARVATGDRDLALTAIGEALRLDPDHKTAIERHRLLSPLDRTSDRPLDRPLTIFFWHRQSLGYDDQTPRVRGLGGTESAVVYLAEALARRGHRVGVFNTCASPHVADGVEYARWQDLPARAAIDRPDVLVSIRHWEPIQRNRFAPLQLFWTGDAYDQPYWNGIAADPERGGIDFVVLQSAWQIETVQRTHNVAPWRIVPTRLGFSPRPHVENGDAAPRARRLAYTSTPFRGLDVLLDVFPAIRQRCADAELRVFSSMRVYGLSEADDRRRFKDIYRRAQQPGVTLVGSLPQPELADQLGSCRVLAYPNHWPETFCIAAIEAQAAGCPVLTSAVGALPETVGDGGLCVEGDPRSTAYQQAFVNAAVELITDDERWTAFSRRALSRSYASYSWDTIAHEWETFGHRALRREPPEVERIVTHLAAGRMSLAANMTARTPQPDGVAGDAWSDFQSLVNAAAAQQDIPAALAFSVCQTFGSIRRMHVLEALHRGASSSSLRTEDRRTPRVQVARNGHAD